MSKLKEKLLPLFQTVWGQSNPYPSIHHAEIDLAMQHLQTPGSTCGVLSALLSEESLHRHIVVVQCPDQAFYPDAIRTYLYKQGLQPLQMHSVLFSRDTSGLPQEARANTNELFLVMHFSAAAMDNFKKTEKDIYHILQAVHQSVIDFSDMLGILENAAAHLMNDAQEDAALLRWMLDEHYLLFGLFFPQHTRINKGICKRKTLLSYIAPKLFDELEGAVLTDEPGMQWIHLTATFAHMYSHTNVRAVQISWLEQGTLRSLILIGHFSRSARYTNASQLPHLKNIWQGLAKDVLLKQSAFYQREIRMLFDRAPKSLLHSIPAEQWLAPFKAIVDLQNPTAVVVEKLSPCQGNMDYLLIVINSHRFGDNIWQHMQQVLQDLGLSIWGDEGYNVGGSHLIFVAVSGATWPNQQELHQGIEQCVLFWRDKAKHVLLQKQLKKSLLYQALAELSQIPALYQAQFPPEQFVQDVIAQAELEQNGQTQIRVNLVRNGEQRIVEVQVLAKQTMPLAQMTEKLNAFALVTMEQALVPMQEGVNAMHICKFRCEAPQQLHAEGLKRLCVGIADVFNDRADHDPLNALVILAGLSIQDILVMIGLRNHLAQLMPNVSIGALSQVMIKYKQVSVTLFRWFEGKHRPAMPVTQATQAQADFEKAMTSVQNLKEDTWLRALSEIVQASQRCNVWVKEKEEAIAIKVDTSAISFAPYPKPYREIFVHGTHVEGIHLRAGKIARGGLRYSDRPTDFRTEVLELMTTQVVKNGQIVPTGAKGGFVVRDGEGADFVLAQYHQFIRALLSITDNRVAGKLLPPQGIRIAEQDNDDAYLVVAADKGTARYSDDANEEALNAGFWLGDAFASGGSHGYDHKAFGITARGAWMCAAHHFAKRGVDLWQDEVSAVGIGDMGGDVFGNGMLLNPNLKLLAAFNHIHIFLDPNPDVEATFAERKRLFDAVKGWGDYDKDLISQGGGVFDRNAKSIVLSDEVRLALGLGEEKMSGEALIRAILKAPVDLLYNGGIGTYVKASVETDADAQDPANNMVRVNANTLRCKAVCEGGNLGFTQAARFEYAQECDGMINTDAIDNAAGVNMSDHEVNLKILLADVSFKQRNVWLLKAANEVAEQCLSDNQAQAIALSLAEETAQNHLPRLQYLQQSLLDEGYIQTRVGDNELALRPVLSEWLGHEKNRIHQALDVSDFYKKSFFGGGFLEAYFPSMLRKKFENERNQHALAIDISHTRITSYVVNRYGLTCVQFLQNLTGLPVAEIVQAILIADKLLGTEPLYQNVLAEGGIAVADWYVVQQEVINFAEGLLVLPNLMNVDKVWLQHTHKTLANYAAKYGKDIEKLTPLVTAIALAETSNKPLMNCLQVTAQCLDVLPFVVLEDVLRTPLWASHEAHALRREWLGRLRQLKMRAAREMLKISVKKQAVLLQQWQQHALQHDLQEILSLADTEAADVSSVEQRRLRFILALTHLQSIVECECNLS